MSGQHSVSVHGLGCFESSGLGTKLLKDARLVIFITNIVALQHAATLTLTIRVAFQKFIALRGTNRKNMCKWIVSFLSRP
eukprot:16445407-Heterocapsa_arctica.AAC.1